MIGYPVLLTYSNIGYIKFAENLLRNLNSVIKNHTLIFYCLDEETYKFVKEFPVNFKIEIVQWFRNLPKEFASYGTKPYFEVIRHKTDILLHAVELYPFIHFIDCDVVCIHEPSAEYYEKYKDYDMIFQYDQAFRSQTEVLEPHLHLWLCTGNFTVWSTEKSKMLLKTWKQAEEFYPKKMDQECLVQIFLDTGYTDYRKVPYARLQTYPYDEFTCGAWIRDNIGDLSRCYFFHANHVEGSNAKKELLKKAGYWYLSE